MKFLNKLFNFNKALLQENVQHYFFLLLVITLYVGIVGLWHRLNYALPTSDAVAYLTDAYSLYNKFFDNGFISGLINLFQTRSWRPQIFPFFSVPFLILLGNKPLTSVGSVSVLFSLFLIVYLYLFLRLRLSPLFAAISAMFIGTFPLVFIYTLNFFSEIAYMPFMLASLYHLCKSNYFSEYKNSLLSGIFVGLTICIRPAEAILFVGTLLPFIILGIINRNIILKEILISLNVVVATILLLFYINYVFPYKNYFKFLFGLAIAYFLLKQLINLYKKKQSPFLIFIFSICLINGVYWMPAVDKLINWSFEASVGDVVQSLGISTLNFLGLLKKFILSWETAWLPFILSLPVLLFAGNYKYSFDRLTYILLLAFSLSILILVITYSFAVYDGQILRRSVVIGIIMCISLMFITINKDIKYKNITFTIVALITLYNYVNILNITLNLENRISYFKLSKINRLFGDSLVNTNIIPQPKDGPIDKHILVVKEIEKRACKYDPKDCLVNKTIYATEPVVYNNSSLDPFTIGFVSSHYRKNDFNLGFVFIPAHLNRYEEMKKRNVKYIFVQVNEDIKDKELYDIANKKTFSSVPSALNFASELLIEYRKNKFEKLKLIDTIIVDDTKVLILQNPDVSL